MNLKLVNYTKLSSNEHIELLEIRNFSYVRKNMKNEALIKLEDHLSWIKTLNNDNTKTYFAVFSDNILVGGINITDIDMEQKTSSWGLFVRANINPMVPSISTYLIIDKVFRTLDVNTLNLEVNKLNINAYKFDKNFGFIDNGEYDDEDNSYYLMCMNKQDWETKKDSGLLKVIKLKIERSQIEII